MKTKILLFLTMACLGLQSQAQTGAAIEYKISAAAGSTGNLKIYCAPQGSRTEMHILIPGLPGGGISRTMLIKKDKPQWLYEVNDKDKSYKETELKNSPLGTDTVYTVAVVGKEKVGAYACIHVKITQGKETYDMWTTKGITGYQAYLQYASNKYMVNSRLNKALLAKKADGFPVKITTTENNVNTSVQLVSFKKSNLAASIFEIPADYKNATPPPAPPPPPPPAPKPAEKKPTLEDRAKQLEDLKKKLPIK